MSEDKIVHAVSPIIGKKHIQNIDEQELLALFNGWLDGERFNDDLTEEEQDACWIVLDIVKRHQEGKL